MPPPSSTSSTSRQTGLAAAAAHRPPPQAAGHQLFVHLLLRGGGITRAKQRLLHRSVDGRSEVPRSRPACTPPQPEPWPRPYTACSSANAQPQRRHVAGCTPPLSQMMLLALGKLTRPAPCCPQCARGCAAAALICPSCRSMGSGRCQLWRRRRLISPLGQARGPSPTACSCAPVLLLIAQHT